MRAGGQHAQLPGRTDLGSSQCQGQAAQYLAAAHAVHTCRRLLTGRSRWLHSASKSPGAARGSGAHPAVWFSANRCTNENRQKWWHP